MRRRPRIGDLLEVSLDSSQKGYFQYVADDASQLHSNVVRVFRRRYKTDEPFDLASVAADDVDFYAHVLLPLGLKLQCWRNVAQAHAPESIEILFRDSYDYGNPSIRVSKDWFVWRVNEPFERVGELRGRYKDAEIGVVVPPDSLIFRMQNGRYDFVYLQF